MIQWCGMEADFKVRVENSCKRFSENNYILNDKETAWVPDWTPMHNNLLSY